MESDSLSDSQSNINHLLRRTSKTCNRRPQFLLNTRMKSSCGKSTGRTNDSEEQIISPSLNLTLYGSPAPKCLQRPSGIKPKKVVQPPNTPIDSAKIPSKPFQLPIENIILLSERLEINNKEKIKVDLSARKIKISDSDKEKCYMFKEESHDILSSSTIDLSIDLSSVTNSDHETESSSDDAESLSNSLYRYVPHKCEERCESTSTLSQSPLPCVWNETDQKMCSRRSNDASETSYPRSRTTGRRSVGSDSILFTDSNESGETSESAASATSKQIPKSSDLIYVYVNTIDDHDKLLKYFRVCETCNKACCICPDLVPDTHRTFFLKEFEEKISDEKNLRSASRCSEFSNFLQERCNLKKDLLNDSGTSTLQLDSDSFRSREKSIMDRLMSSSSSSQKQVTLSMMQLATAAQCARILANSLESVLEMTIDQTASPRESIRNENFVQFKDVDLKDLFQSFDNLKNSFQSVGAIGIKEATWINFDKIEKSSDNDFGFEDNFDVRFLESKTFIDCNNFNSNNSSI